MGIDLGFGLVLVEGKNENDCGGDYEDEVGK